MESIFDLPFQRRSFDRVLYFGLPAAMSQLSARLLLCDAARVVKPNGIVALLLLHPPLSSAVGPAWTRGELEQPDGLRDMGGWSSAQQHRLHVDERGVAVEHAAAAPLSPSPSPSPSLPQHSFTDAAWLAAAASTCGLQLLSTAAQGQSLSGVLPPLRRSW